MIVDWSETTNFMTQLFAFAWPVVGVGIGVGVAILLAGHLPGLISEVSNFDLFLAETKGRAEGYKSAAVAAAREDGATQYQAWRAKALAGRRRGATRPGRVVNEGNGVPLDDVPEAPPDEY